MAKAREGAGRLGLGIVTAAALLAVTAQHRGTGARGEDKADEANSDSKFNSERKAIDILLRDFIGVYLSKENKAPGKLESRAEQLRAFYLPPQQFGSDRDVPLFFGPVTAPVVRGPDPHIDNVNTAFEWFLSQKTDYRIRVDSQQIFPSRDMALVVLRTTGVVTFPDGEVEENPSRWTIVLTKDDRGQWKIFHEHMSRYSREDGAPSSDNSLNRLRRDIKALKLNEEAGEIPK